MTLRVVLGEGNEGWDDLLDGQRYGPATVAGDPRVRDRQGNWTYGFAVVVDDLRQDIDLVVRGQDLAEATPGQIRLARLLGRSAPARFAHHSLILKPNGAKLSKADGDTGVRDLREAGLGPEAVIGLAASAIGLIDRARNVRAQEMATLTTLSRTESGPRSR